MLKLARNAQNEVFLAVWVLFFFTFWAGQGVAYVGSAQNIKSVTCSCVPSCFSFVL